MQKIILSGCNGQMGQTVTQLCENNPSYTIVAGFDINNVRRADYPVYSDPTDYPGPADAVIDFSHPSFLTSLLIYCTRRRLPVVLCTTGYAAGQKEEIARAAAQIPIFQSANMSLGVNVLLELVKQAASLLGSDWDIEIVERHHNRKVDAPSGTALMLADAISEVLPYRPDYVYDRQSIRRPRERREIGISSIRGGGIPGDHEILFAGENEVIELRHSAQSRGVFAAGALRAAAFISTVSEPGMYSMQDLVGALRAGKLAQYNL
jgi:4-hydroxy-tetrahydrodipicolinate reductase